MAKVREALVKALNELRQERRDLDNTITQLESLIGTVGSATKRRGRKPGPKPGRRKKATRTATKGARRGRKKKAVIKKKTRKTYRRTAAQRKAASLRMKKQWAEKRKKEAG